MFTFHPRLKRGFAHCAATSAAILALTAMFVSSAAARPDKSHVRKATTTSTIVLVHGAWADGSSWNNVYQLLRSWGFKVVIPPNPLQGLASDSADVADYLHKGVSGPIVLVGHSYGGAVITNAAVGDPNVKALVYVDAYIPKQGQTLLELTSAQPGSCLGGEPADAFNFVPFVGAPAGDFDTYMKQAADGSYPGFANCFANTLPSWKAEALWAEQRPLALNALLEPSGPPAWTSIPSWDVIGTEDHLIPPAEQTIMAKEAHAATTYLRAPHVSMVARPEVVAGVIAHAASATS